MKLTKLISMKMMMNLGVAATMAMGSIASAASPMIIPTLSETAKVYTLGKVAIDEQETRYLSRVTVDEAEATIRVEIWQDPCGQLLPVEPGVMRCMAAARLITEMDVPLQSVSDECGSKVYEGTLDETRFDGYRTSVRVIDHTLRLCEDRIESLTLVEAYQLNPWTNKTTTYRLLK